MVIRQGDTYQTVNNTVEPDIISVSLRDPNGIIMVLHGTPDYDEDTGIYSYDYSFPSDAILGNWVFSWDVDGENTDEVILLQAALTATYADPTEAQKLTREVREGLHNSDDYEDLLVRALKYSDRKINNRLKKEGIGTPAAADEDLMEAGNLYAAALIFNTYYSSNDRTSPTAAAYKNDADEFLESYIDGLEKTDTEQSKYQSSKLPGHTIREVLDDHDHPEYPPGRLR
jgi:hypothetical protein